MISSVHCCVLLCVYVHDVTIVAVERGLRLVIGDVMGARGTSASPTGGRRSALGSPCKVIRPHVWTLCPHDQLHRPRMGLTNLVRGAAQSISAGSPAKQQQQQQPQSPSTGAGASGAGAGGGGSSASAPPSTSTTPAPASANDEKIVDGAPAEDTEVLDDEPKNSQSSRFPGFSRGETRRVTRSLARAAPGWNFQGRGHGRAATL